MKANFAGSALRFLPAFFLALAPVVPALGQQTPAQVLRNPEVNYPVHVDISPPLSQMATEVSPQQGLHLAPPVQHPKLQLLMAAAQPARGLVEDAALQKYVGPFVSATIGLNLLGVGNGFPNYAVPDAPTDVNLAVGDTQVVQWVNVSYAVFNKTTGAVIAGPIAGNQFWAGFGGACQTSNSGDIIAQWDKVAHRWVMTQNVFSSPYLTCVAVSTTPDATGTYYRFSFPQSAGFPDYPKWGIWPDAYYQSNNIFSGNNYTGAHPCAYERAKMLVGDSTAKQICFLTGTFDDGLLPGDLDSAATPPPTGQPEVFLGSIDNGTPNIYEYLFHVDFTTPANSTFTGAGGTMPVTGVSSFSLACGGFSACIAQKGVTDLLDSLGDRLMYRLAYRNFSGDHQTWLVSHSVTAGSSVGERWYEFRAPEKSTTLSAYQQGTFAPDSSYRWMGSIAMDQAGDIALGYSVSSSSLYPSIAYTGQAAGDPLNTMETEATIVSGTGSQTATSNRWGDYTSMALDAADDCTFWYTNQYYMATASFDWSTRLASFKFPNCGSGSSTPTTTTASSLPNPSSFGQSVTFTSTTTSNAGTPMGTVTFTEGATVWASNVPVSNGQASFNTTALAVGSHTITATFTGATGWANSSGNAAPQVVTGTATTTTASSSPNPSVFGQSVTFTSTTSGAGTPTGTVTFTEGSTVWASNVTVNGSGQASFSTTALAVGSHTITATFTGTNGWANSSGNAPSQVVNKANTTTAVISSANPSVFSQPVKFTATVTATAPGSGVPTGTVTFKNGSTTLGTGTLNGNGVATFTTSTLAVGSASITAAYGGSTSFNTSSSSTLTQTVNQDATTTTVTSSRNPSRHNQSVTFTATVVANAPGTATPTGTVTFYDGTKNLHSGSLSGSGQATYTISNLSTGKHQITVVYGGSSSFLTSTSAVLVQTVN